MKSLKSASFDSGENKTQNNNKNIDNVILI